MGDLLSNVLIGSFIFVLGAIVGYAIFALFYINKVDALIYSDKLRRSIIAKLKYYQNCWEALADKDNNFLIGKIESIKTAIYVINTEFDKAESEVEGK